MKALGIFALVSLAGLAACGGPDDSSLVVPTNNDTANNAMSNNGTPNNGVSNNGAPNNGGLNNVAPGDVTYHNSVRALVEANCSGCHYEGGIGPFPRRRTSRRPLSRS